MNVNGSMIRPAPIATTSRRLVLLLNCIVPLAFGGLALVLGQDANWDLKNYHWYNPYALLTDRWLFDLSPASYYNPAIDVPTYLAAQALSARTLTFILGLVHGLNFILLFALARAASALSAGTRSILFAAAIAFVGMIGGGHIGILGTTFGDNVVSLFVFGSVLLALRAQTESRPTLVIIVAGVVMGIAVGLKLPMAVFAVGFCAALLFVAGPLHARFMLAFGFGIGVLFGIGISAGYWLWMMARDFGNPLFPYFNGLFRSPLGLENSYRDTRFIPKDFLTAVFFPFVFSFDSKRVGEIVFRDFRIVTAYALWIVTAVMLLMRRSTNEPLIAPAVAHYLAIAAFGVLVVWTPIFAIYRYIIPLEMLAPLLCIAAIGLWPLSVRTRTATAGVVLLLLAITAAPGTWVRQENWTQHLVEVSVPPIADPAHTMVLMVGFDPASYVIPAFPPQIPFLRIQGYFNDPNDGDTGFNRLLRERITAHQGDIFLLVASWEEDKAARALAYYGLAADFAHCADLATNLSRDLKWCALSRAP